MEILGLREEELREKLIEMGEQGFRASQVFDWIYKGAEGFDEMKNLPKALREKLMEGFDVGLPKVVAEQVSKEDGTRKYLLELSDGNAIESVFMKYHYGNSICVSSQAGCRMGCRFCASTIDGLERNLTAGEILGQVLRVEREAGEKINHIVVMGSGEPFDNYENLKRFLELATDPKTLGLSSRNITVSTCGVIPGIERFADDFPQVNLAISLHASEDESRSEIMPINKKYPLKQLIEAAKVYTDKTHRRVSFEFTLVSGVNDSDEDAEKLVNLLKGMLCHVNIIPLNPVREREYSTVNRERAKAFAKILEDRGIPATVRRELGGDIDGACGQLRLSKKKSI